MKQRRVPSVLRSYLPYALSIGAILVFGFYVYRNADRYLDLFDFSSTAMLLLLGLVLLFPLANGLINYHLYRGLGVPLPFGESFGLAAVNTLANQLPFAGGLVAKGVYLKHRHNLSYARFASATAALYACFVAANGTVGVVVIAILAARGRTVPVPLKAGFAAMTASLALLWLPVDTNLLPERFRKHFTELVRGWQVLRRKRTLLLKLVGLQIVTTLAGAGRFWIAFHTLSQDVTYAQCVLFSSATVLTRLISIAPGGLGVREGVVAGIATLLGFEPGTSAVAVALDRVVATSVIVVLGTVYTYILAAKATDPDQANPTTTQHE